MKSANADGKGEDHAEGQCLVRWQLSRAGSDISPQCIFRLPIAESENGTYITLMRPRSRCRIHVILIVFALVLGLVLHGAQTTPANAGMMPLMTADMSSMGDCDACGGDGDMDQQVCAAMCFSCCGSTVLPVEPAAAASQPADLISLPPAARFGVTGPPDPFPPRPFIQI